jgi:hypothetical protein
MRYRLRTLLIGLFAVPIGSAMGGMIGGLLIGPALSDDKNVVLTAILYGIVIGAALTLALLTLSASRTRNWAHVAGGAVAAALEGAVIAYIITSRLPR